MRDYDPTTGRYIEADPLGLVDGASVYGYARQNPGRYVDPRGEEILALGYGPVLWSPNWVPDLSLPPAIGARWTQRCSNAQLVFHFEGSPKKSHWHYHPEGDTTGGREAPTTRWKDPLGNDHLYPIFLLEVPDCPCDGGAAVDTWAAMGLSLLALLLASASGPAGIGAQ